MFTLTPRQLRKLNKWRTHQDAIRRELEKQSISKDDSDYQQYKEHWDVGLPYSKSRNETFSFTPGLISVVIVTNYLTGASIDLTEDEEL